MKSYKDLKLTLRYHETLNPKFWNNYSLKSEVRKALLKIADEWAEFAQIPSSAILDITLVGGNTNYNYTKFSDLDLHLLVDKSKIANCPEILNDYLMTKKGIWALTHDIKIYGHPVELYAQDKDEKTSSNQGVYSLKNNEWVRRPTYSIVNLKDPSIKEKVQDYMNRIDFLIDNKSDDPDAFVKLKEKIRNMRSSGIARGGEFGVENLVFKELRNLGYLKKLSDHLIKIKQKNLSLK